MPFQVILINIIYTFYMYNVHCTYIYNYSTLNTAKRCFIVISRQTVSGHPSSVLSYNRNRKTLEYARSFAEISDEEADIILHCKKSLLFHNNEVWTKTNNNTHFDVTMGSLDGAETYELVGLYLLNSLRKEIAQENVGLYRDDGLIIVKKANGHTLDSLRKRIIRIFKNEGLKITIEANLTTTDFLDVTLDLNSGKYFPYRKPNDKPIYVNTKSNHPPTILKQIPSMISTRISKLSCDKDEFLKSKPFYDNILKKSGYNEGLTYNPNANKPHKRKRQRKIIWYNPPFSLNVKTNIGRRFLLLLKKTLHPAQIQQNIQSQ